MGIWVESMSSEGNVIAWGLVILVLLLAVFVVVPWVQDALDPNPVKITTFRIAPLTVSEGEKATLTITISNRKSQALTVEIFLETSPNVEILLDSSLLPKTGGNYTYQIPFSQGEQSSTLVFYVRGSLDVGDASRDYYVKGYFMTTEFKNPIVVSQDFTVTKG